MHISYDRIIYLFLCKIFVIAFLSSPVIADSSYNNKWAILIGVTNYQYVDGLLYPGNDVDDMHSVLINSCGFPSTNIFTYKDAQATRSGIHNAITQLSYLSGNDDLVVFFFSGHGLGSGWLVDQAPYDESDGYDEIISPYDSSPYSFTYDISDDELQTWLSLIKSKNTVCIIDTCGSGGMTKSGLKNNLSQPLKLVYSLDITEDDGFARDFTKDINGKKFVVLMAANDNEDSWDIYALQNGLFSYYLTQGLTKKDANIDNDEWISVEEAFNSAKIATTNYKSSQHPQILDGDVSTEVEIYPLSTLPTPSPTPTSPTPTPTTITPTPTQTNPTTLTADFTASKTSGTAPLTVRFQDTSQGNPTGWIWDINGDGFRDYSDRSIEHVYTSPGYYSVTFSITRNQELVTITRPNYIHVLGENPTPDTMTLDLQTGWNLLSTPKTLAEGHRTRSEVFSGINTAGHSTFGYNAQTQSWVQLNSNDEIQPLRGIWIYSATPEQVSLTFNDNPISSTYELSQGWNSIGFSKVDPVSAKDALLPVQNAWAQLLGFNAASQFYETSIINGGSGTHSDTNIVYPGKGYWVFMNGQGMLS